MGGEQACRQPAYALYSTTSAPFTLRLSLQPVEYGLNAVLAVFLLVTGKWIAATIHIAVSLYNLRIYLQREHVVDVTEIFRQLPKQKMMRMVKLVIFLFSFVLIIYRYVCHRQTHTLSVFCVHICIAICLAHANNISCIACIDL